jgi:hypothetical protein
MTFVQRRSLFVFLLGLLLSGVCPPFSPAQSPSEPDTSLTLEEALRRNRYPLRVENDSLRGEGGAWLVEQAEEATVVTLGESHGTKEIPAVMGALFRELQRAGELDHLALEISPWTAALMTDRLRAEPGAYTSFIKEHPASIPFYFLKPERDLVQNFVQNSEAERPLWGLDQIFAFATTIALNRLAELAPTPDARSAVQHVRAAGKGDSLNAEALPKLPPAMPTPLMAYPPAAFDTLRSHFSEVPEARRLLDEITTSIPIYRINDTDNYRSNQMRARYLRRNLLSSFTRAQQTKKDPPQVAIKVGGRHAYRDRTPNNALDVGNLAVALAEETGGTALNVGVFCGPNSSYRDFPAGTSDCWSETRSVFKPALNDEPALFDLTALHPLLHDGTLDPNNGVERLLWAFDAVVLIPNASPSSYIAPPTGS